MQYIDRKEPSTGLGANLNNILQQLGTGIAQNLQQRRQKQETAAGLMAMLPGTTPEQAEMMSGMNPLMLKEYLKQTMSRSGRKGLADLIMSSEGSSQLPELTGDMLNISKLGDTLQPQKEIVPVEATPVKSELMKTKAVTTKTPSTWKEKPEFPQIPQIDKKNLSKALNNMTPAEMKEFNTLRKEQKKEVKDEQIRIEKKLQPYIKELDLRGGEAAEETEMVLNKMEKLVDSNKLTSSGKYNFYKKLETSGKYIGGGLGTALGGLAGGILGSTVIPGIGAIGGAATGGTVGGGLGTAVGEMIMPKFVGSKEDQQFQKLGTYFLRNLRGIFGAKPAIQEMEAYMAGIPNLAQTDEGKKEVIHDLRLMNAGWRYRKKIKDDILKETHGIVPTNLTDMINERSKPYLEKIKSQFLNEGLKSLEIDF